MAEGGRRPARKEARKKGPDHERTRAVGTGAAETAADAAGTGAGAVIRTTEPAGAATQPAAAGSGRSREALKMEDPASGSTSRSSACSNSHGADSACHPATASHCPKQRPAFRHRASLSHGAPDQHASPAAPSAGGGAATPAAARRVRRKGHRQGRLPSLRRPSGIFRQHGR